MAASKGNANKETLAERMKSYEAVTTGMSLVRNLPIYMRIDMRAGHSFCKGLDKPFDMAYSQCMKATTMKLVDEFCAAVGYTQSDEISLVWKDDSKVPFGTRIFKLQSVAASVATSAFILEGLKTKLKDKILKNPPSFDARVLNLPSLAEAANMLLWREEDSIKNSITLLALEHYSTKQLHKKNGDEKIKMLLHEKKVDYFSAIPEDLRNGAYFHRVVEKIRYPEADWLTIPEKWRPPKEEDGHAYVVRSCIKQFFLGSRLQDLEMDKKIEFLFGKDEDNEA